VSGARAAVLDAVRAALGAGSSTAYDIARAVYAERWSPGSATWLLGKTLAWLTHLERRGEVRRAPDGDRERWLRA
jgi:hypothetical protein